MTIGLDEPLVCQAQGANLLLESELRRSSPRCPTNHAIVARLTPLTQLVPSFKPWLRLWAWPSRGSCSRAIRVRHRQDLYIDPFGAPQGTVTVSSSGQMSRPVTCSLMATPRRGRVGTSGR